MSFFIDTNMAIGYSVVHDKWHDNAVKFICETEEDIFWSNLVQKEYCKKLGKIISIVERFLKRANLLLKNNETSFTNYKEFENFILKETKDIPLDKNKKITILENFWWEFDFCYEVPQILFEKFNDYYDGFQNVYFTRNSKLENMIKLHDCGIDNYLRYLDYANKLFEWGIHSPDCKIVTDAHDCGLKHDKLVFVSTDEKMINNISRHNHSFLSIIEFRSCN
ncbi:hypothetical protein [Methanobrevibacter sp.]|uniref:hypothetical protein n=1 Tax=Methanobrevibacter sp. TaxID=66852 RepID=UPI0026DEDE2F|nr:hypothetical protein [Methanobrevibacter sp.]MDO5859309.1 hypothetical protein [Methanobrevibacter sp.]